MFLGITTSRRPLVMHWVSNWFCISHITILQWGLFLVPGFAICNTDKGDGGLTLDEFHADICQDFIASVGDSDAAELNFWLFDSNADGVVTLKEFLDLADSLINQ